jgi:hypothetical protein
MASSAGALANDDLAQDQPEEIVITLEDLDRYVAALLRVYALSNEITLRVAAKREDLMDLHKEFNARAVAILNKQGMTIDRYNKIERTSELIPDIFEAIKERVQRSDDRLQRLARSPKTLDDAKLLLQGKVSYPVTAQTLPWFADEEDIKGMATNHMGGPGATSGPAMIPGFPGMGSR